jgi:hypothetical protein
MGRSKIIYVGDYMSVRKITASAEVTTIITQYKTIFSMFIDKSEKAVSLVLSDGSVVPYSTSSPYNNNTALLVKLYSASYVYDNSGSNLYSVSYQNHTLNQINSNSGVSTVLAGNYNLYSSKKDGVGTNATFYYPRGLAIDKDGNFFLADYYGYSVRKVSATSPHRTMTVAGKSYGIAQGYGTSGKFRYTTGVALDSSGRLFVTVYPGMMYMISTGCPNGQYDPGTGCEVIPANYHLNGQDTNTIYLDSNNKSLDEASLGLKVFMSLGVIFFACVLIGITTHFFFFRESNKRKGLRSQEMGTYRNDGEL